jgi:acetoacetate decarboxylase
MKIADVRAGAFAMPLNGPYRFYDREYFVIEYLTDPDALRAVVPEPLKISDPIVKFEFIRLGRRGRFAAATDRAPDLPAA